MTNVRYTDAQRLKTLEVFDRTQSATKTEVPQVLFRLSIWENLEYAKKI